MNRITSFALKNAAVIVIIALLLIGGGIYSAGQLKQESMPDITIPVVAVVTVYPGAAPGDVYNDVTKPIETALQGVAGVDKRQATSADSVSAVVAQFGYSTDMDKAESDIRKTLEGVKLPTSAQAPQIKRISFGSAAVVKLAVTGAGSEAEQRAAVQDTVLPALKGVEGVGDATVANDAENKVRIVFDPAKLKKHNLTAATVVQQMQGANLSYPVGTVDIGTESQSMRVSGTLDSVDEIKDFTVAIYPDSTKIYTKAFQAIGSGMSALGSGMGQLGSGMGQLGAGLGAVGKATGTVAQIQGMQGALVKVTVPLNNAQQAAAAAQKKYDNAQAVLGDTTPPLPSDYDLKAAAKRSDDASAALRTANMTVAMLQPQAQALEGMIAKAQSALAASAGSSSGSSGGSGSSAASGGSGSSGGGLSMSTSGMKIKTVRLSDVATVTYGAGADAVGSRQNGQPAALIDIIKSQDANTVDTCDRVKAEVATLEKKLPAGSKVTIVYDGSVSIRESVDGMLREGLLGALFAFIVILLFLRDWRSTLIAVISIPMSILACMVFLNQVGITLNVMTLGGLTVAIGRVVDDSIVVIENIHRHLSLGEPRTAETIRLAVSEVSSAITSSTLTTVAVFLPLGMVTGIIGKVFQPFAYTVALALLASLVVAITVVPLIAKWTMLKSKVKHVEEGGGKAAALYRNTLGWCLDHKIIVFAVAGAMLVGSLMLVSQIGTAFMPEAKEKYINITVEYPQGTKATTVDTGMRRIEGLLTKNPEVELYNSSTGSAGGFSFSGGVQGSNQGAMYVKLKDDVESSRDEADKLRGQLKSFESEGVKITVAAQSNAQSSSSIEVDLIGDNKADIATAADMVTKKMAELDGLENVSNNVSAAREQIAIDVDQRKAAKKGEMAALVFSAMRGYIAEQDVGTTKIKGKDTSIIYQLKYKGVDNVAQIANTKLTTPMGKKIKLKSIASVVETASPVSVLTKDGTQYAAVSGAITARDSGKVITATKAAVAELKLPAGVTAEVAGTAQQMNEAFSQLGIAMIIAIAAVYLVMVIAFGEAVAPLAIMFSLPLAIIGGLVGMWLAKLPIDMPAMIGALMLIGIVVTNAIVLIELVQQKRKQGEPMREALQNAGATRMRPILMTALATVFALVPLASGMSEGALISQSLAVIVIGGLTTSTLLTLVVVPVAYALLEGWREKLLGSRHETPDGDGGGNGDDGDDRGYYDANLPDGHDGPTTLLPEVRPAD